MWPLWSPSTTAPPRRARIRTSSASPWPWPIRLGPFDWHLTKKLVDLCRDEDIRFQKDIFRHYRSDSASAIEAGHDVRTALITFGVDASHGYERIHMHALALAGRVVTAYVASPVEIARDATELGPLNGFTTQPMEEAEQELSSEGELPDEES
jgi:hypothetical protein